VKAGQRHPRATRMEWNASVWESSLDYGMRTRRLAIDTHAITSDFALPLLIKQPGGLVVEVGDGTDEYNATHYRVSFFYDPAKAAGNRMAFALGHELSRCGCSAVSVTPGWLRSEAMLEIYGDRIELARRDQEHGRLCDQRDAGLPRAGGGGAGR
jgi:NAD(P)-dependent dehydrogenase (short-subunit alcohol dehydrogenase family)